MRRKTKTVCTSCKLGENGRNRINDACNEDERQDCREKRGKEGKTRFPIIRPGKSPVKIFDFTVLRDILQGTAIVKKLQRVYT